jgi:sulfide:quinone oxidoreductase
MDIRKVNDVYSVCPQIGTDDIPLVAGLGFKSIICNRPDGESWDQPLFETLETAAVRAGLGAVYLPVAPSGPTAADVAHFASLFAELPKPVLAYCRSGARSLAIWTAGVGVEAR